MPRVIHFEMQSEDPERASDFYHEVFGWMVSKKKSGDEDYWLIATGRNADRGINGGMKQRSAKTEKRGMIPTIEVENLDAILVEVVKKGGKIVEAKRPLSGTGYLAYCEDTEANIFALLQYDGNVK